MVWTDEVISLDRRGFDRRCGSPIRIVDDTASERRAPYSHHCHHYTDED
jgi:hypothetical protein